MSVIHKNLDLETLSKFIKDEVIPHENNDPGGKDYNSDQCKRLFELGYWQAGIPKNCGGRGLGVVELLHAMREVAYGSASLSASFIGNLLGQSPLMLYGQDELRQKVLKESINDFKIWSFAMTEKGVGSDLADTQTNMHFDGSNIKLNGEKNFITNATYCDHLCTFAKDRESQQINALYVPASFTGVKKGEFMIKTGWKKANTGTLIFDNVDLPAQHLLGDSGRGLSILTHCLNRSKTLLAGVAVGVAHRSIDLATERLSQIQRFGKPLIRQSAIRHVLARAHTQMEAAWLMSLRAAETWDAGKPAVKEASMAKLFAGGVARNITTEMIELFGARGVFEEYEISRLNADAKIIEIVEGPSLVQELLIAKECIPRNEIKAQDVYKIDPVAARQEKKAS